MSRRKKPILFHGRGHVSSFKCWDKCMESFYSKPQALDSPQHLERQDRNLSISWETTSSDTDEEEPPHSRNVLPRKSSVVTRLNFDSCQDSSDKTFSRRDAVGNDGCDRRCGLDEPGSLRMQRETFSSVCESDKTVAEGSKTLSLVAETGTCLSGVKFAGNLHSKTVKEHLASAQKSHCVVPECTRSVSSTAVDESLSPCMRGMRQDSTRGLGSPVVGTALRKRKSACDRSSNDSYAGEPAVHVVSLRKETSHETGVATEVYLSSPVLTAMEPSHVREKTPVATDMCWRPGVSLHSPKSPAIKSTKSETYSPTLGSQKRCKKQCLHLPEGKSSVESKTKTGCHKLTNPGAEPSPSMHDNDECSVSSVAGRRLEKKNSCRKLFKTIAKKLQSKEALHPEMFQSRNVPSRNSFPGRKAARRKKFKTRKTLLKLSLGNPGCGICSEPEETPRRTLASSSHEGAVSVLPRSSPVLTSATKSTVMQGKMVRSMETLSATKQATDSLDNHSLKKSTHSEGSCDLPVPRGSTGVLGETHGREALNISEVSAATHPGSPVIRGRLAGVTGTQSNVSLSAQTDRHLGVCYCLQRSSRDCECVPHSSRTFPDCEEAKNLKAISLSDKVSLKEDTVSSSSQEARHTFSASSTFNDYDSQLIPESPQEQNVSPVLKKKNLTNQGGRQLIEIGKPSPIVFHNLPLDKNDTKTAIQVSIPDKQPEETAFQKFIIKTMEKVQAHRSQVVKEKNPRHLAQVINEVESSSVSSASFVIESVSSQEVSSSQKIEATQGSGRRISPVLSQEMKVNEGTGSEPSAPSGASSPVPRGPAPRGPAPRGPTPDVDSARKTARKRYRKGSLCARLHRLVARQRSQANLWQYELGRPASRGSGAGRGDARGTVLAVRACWRECGRVLLRCERSHAPSVPSVENCAWREADAKSSREREEDSDSSTGSGRGYAFDLDIVVIVDPCVVQVPQLEPGSLVRIYPPWQVMEVPQPRVKVVMCLAHVEVVSRGGPAQPPATSEQRTVPLECTGESGGEALPGRKCLLQLADKGAQLMRCIFPGQVPGERPPRSQAVGERGRGTDRDRGTVAEAVELHSCVLSDRVWLLARVHKVFVYRAARYKLNSSPESEEEIFPQGNRSNLAWSILCRDENNQFCEVELGSLPENCDGLSGDGAGNALSPGRFRSDEPKRDGGSVHRANEPLVSDDISPGNAQVSVGRGTFGKPGEIHPRFSADRNGEPLILFNVERNDSEIEFHSDGNHPRSENKISLCGGDSRSPGVPGDSPCSCETVAEGRRASDCKWFWEALASERVQGGIYKLSGLTLVKRITRNKSPGTWALFREAPSSLPRPRTVPSESEAASASGGNEGGATNLQSMFYVFSTCSEQLQVSSADDSATSFRHMPDSRPPVSLLVDVTEQLRRDSCFRCSLLVKLLMATRGCLYVTDTSLVRQQSAGHRSYVMISVCPSCYVPLEAKNGSLLFLRDVLVHGGGLSADRYTRVTSLPGGPAAERGGELRSLRGCTPAIPRLQLTSSGGDLVSVSGNVVGVDEETAFAWPACAECGGEVLAELPGGRHLCRRCGRAVATETRMSLAVALTCPALPVRSSVRVQLLQKTILELLSHTAKSDEGYDLATVLGQEIGPLLCLVERVQIGKSGVTNFLLEQVPETL